MESLGDVLPRSTSSSHLIEFDVGDFIKMFWEGDVEAP
jgi:hypothetical protein